MQGVSSTQQLHIMGVPSLAALVRSVAQSLSAPAPYASNTLYDMWSWSQNNVAVPVLNGAAMGTGSDYGQRILLHSFATPCSERLECCMGCRRVHAAPWRSVSVSVLILDYPFPHSPSLIGFVVVLVMSASRRNRTRTTASVRSATFISIQRCTHYFLRFFRSLQL
jgi:hypothetical protein